MLANLLYLQLESWKFSFSQCVRLCMFSGQEFSGEYTFKQGVENIGRSSRLCPCRTD